LERAAIMDDQLRRGRKRQGDSILLAIKSAVLEFEYRFARRNPDPEDVREFVSKLKSTYHHGAKWIAPIYVETLTALDARLNSMAASKQRDDELRAQRKEMGIQKW
jgi:hypothetical protein